MKHRLSADLVEVNSLTQGAMDSMFALYSLYYGGIAESLFLQDLSEKQYAIMLRDRGNTIQGFTTLFVGEYKVAGHPLRSIFSGDTVVDARFWGEQTLSLRWCHFAGQLKAQKPKQPLYWFLIVKGHRTYRYLRLFAKVFYPVQNKPTPDAMQGIMNQMCRQRYGENYHASTGIVRFGTTHGYLKKEWAGLNEHTVAKKDVQFFMEKNPGYAEGDELVCLTELAENNLRRHALSSFREGFQ